MVALPLLDVVMSSDQSGRSIRMASELVDAAMSELRSVHKIEETVAPASLVSFDRPTAAMIRGLYEQWAHETESLLERITQAERRFGTVPSAEGLRDALG